MESLDFYLKRGTVAFNLIALLFTVMVSRAAAQSTTTTYQFVGLPFNNCAVVSGDQLVQSTCPPGSHLTGSFTLDSPLPANYVSPNGIGGPGDFSAIAFCFTDGTTTVSGTSGGRFSANTDANGNLSQWSLRVDDEAGDEAGVFYGPKNEGTSAVSGVQAINHGYFFNSIVSSDPNTPGGVWTRIQGYASCITLVDPVPFLLDRTGPNGNASTPSGVTQNQKDIGNYKLTVSGIAADGVTRVIVRIPTERVGDQVSLTLLNDQTAPADFSQDGYLTPLEGGVKTDNVVLQSLDMGASKPPMAFAVYYAPIDFARALRPEDQTSVQRRVYLQTTNRGSLPPAKTLIPVQVVRPPILLVHGLWSEPNIWLKNGFQQALESFFSTEMPKIYRANYKDTNGGSVKLNEGIVLTQLRDDVDAFKMELNVAAVQADVVGHSMGGLIARYTVYDPQTPASRNFRSGYVHKIITINTPHLGSPFPPRFLASSPACKALIGEQIGPALTDLSENSNLLLQLANPLRSLLPSHALAGTVTKAQDDILSHALSTITLGLSDLLCPALVPDQHSYQLTFGHGQPEFNDIAVGITSQLGGDLFSPATNTADYDPSLGIIHSHDTLFFWRFNLKNFTSAIGALDANSPNPQLVFKLLNQMPNSQAFVSRRGYPFQ